MVEQAVGLVVSDGVSSCGPTAPDCPDEIAQGTSISPCRETGITGQVQPTALMPDQQLGAGRDRQRRARSRREPTACPGHDQRTSARSSPSLGRRTLRAAAPRRRPQHRRANQRDPPCALGGRGGPDQSSCRGRRDRLHPTPPAAHRRELNTGHSTGADRRRAGDPVGFAATQPWRPDQRVGAVAATRARRLAGDLHHHEAVTLIAQGRRHSHGRGGLGCGVQHEQRPVARTAG